MLKTYCSEKWHCAGPRSNYIYVGDVCISKSVTSFYSKGNMGVHCLRLQNASYGCSEAHMQKHWVRMVHVCFSLLDVFLLDRHSCCVDVELHRMLSCISSHSCAAHNLAQLGCQWWKMPTLSTYCTDTWLHRLYSYIHIHWRAHDLAQLKHHTDGVLKDLHSSQRTLCVHCSILGILLMKWSCKKSTWHLTLP